MKKSVTTFLFTSVILAALSGCGGGGSGTQIASIPAPPAPPTSAPPPPAQPAPPPPPPASSLPLQPAHIGLVSADPFITLGIGDTYSAKQSGGDEQPLAGPDRSQSVQFTYLPASGTYQISLPNFETGKLVTIGLGGSGGYVATRTFNKVTLGSSPTLQSVSVTLPVPAPGPGPGPFSYTSFGTWDGALGQVNGRNTFAEGSFAYGIPTKAGDVPITGTGVYSAAIHGTSGIGTSYYELGGAVSMSFDFAAGTLKGSMHPGIYDGFGGIADYGQYDFTQTIYSRGATDFSGAFIVPGIPDGTSRSFFEGAFTGPGGAELLARFQAPYLFKGQTGMMSGIWVGKSNNDDNSQPISASH